jgi:diguanylate cyclase (GGDEF)-like protein/PAS domain S-box-containing protein
LATDETFYRDLLDNLYDGVYFADRERRITYWNVGAERITGFKAGEVIGARCCDNVLIHVDDEGTSLCKTACPLSLSLTDGQVREAEVYLHHKDGHRVPVYVRVSPIVDKSGAIIGGVEVFSENTSRMAALERVEELEKMALLDPLTGIGNRRYARMNISARLDELRRYGWPCGLLFLDIDHFKRVNDAHGHAAGDEVLKTVTRTLTKSMRPFDFLGRWGGEEFVAVIANIAPAEFPGVAERTRMLVEQSVIPTAGGDLSVTVSVGAAMARAEDSVEDLVERADRLMYRSKSAGRNRVTLEEGIPQDRPAPRH